VYRSGPFGAGSIRFIGSPNHASDFCDFIVDPDVPEALDALLVARNLERVADHATNIAEDVIFWVRGADVRHNIAPEQSEHHEVTDPH